MNVLFAFSLFSLEELINFILLPPSSPVHQVTKQQAEGVTE